MIEHQTVMTSVCVALCGLKHLQLNSETVNCDEEELLISSSSIRGDAVIGSRAEQHKLIDTND